MLVIATSCGLHKPKNLFLPQYVYSLCRKHMKKPPEERKKFCPVKVVITSFYQSLLSCSKFLSTKISGIKDVTINKNQLKINILSSNVYWNNLCFSHSSLPSINFRPHKLSDECRFQINVDHDQVYTYIMVSHMKKNISLDQRIIS